MSSDSAIVTEPAGPPKAAPRAKRPRQNHCFAPGCKSGQTRIKDSKFQRVSLFRVPKDREMFERWKRYMPPRHDGKQLTQTSSVCARHFDPQFICRYYEHVINKELVRIERGRPVLTPDAVPTIFPDSPKYYTRRVPRRRKLPERTILPPKVPCKRNRAHVPAGDQSDDINNNDTSCVEDVANLDVANDAGAPPSMRSSPRNGGSSSAANQVVPEETVIECEVTPVFPYEDLPLPSRRWAKHVIREKPTVLAYSVCSVNEQDPGQLQTEKLVLIEEKDCHAECSVYVRGVRVHSLDDEGGTDYPSTLLQRVDQLRCCPGAMSTREYPFETLLSYLVQSEGRLYSKQCAIVGTSKGRMCDRCAKARKTIQTKRSRLKLKAARSVVIVVNNVPHGADSGSSSIGLCMDESHENGSTADVNGSIEVGSMKKAEDSSGPGSDVACNANGSEQNTAVEEEVTEVPYETVVSSPVPVHVVNVTT